MAIIIINIYNILFRDSNRKKNNKGETKQQTIARHKPLKDQNRPRSHENYGRNRAMDGL